MKILVCLSQVPDTTTKVKFDATGKSLDKNGVTFIPNPYDDFGLVRAVEFKEKQGVGHIVVITVGKAETEGNVLRKALAIGADEAVRIDAEPQDSYQVASEIAAYARDKQFDIIFAGKESIDFNGSSVAGMIAEMLGLPFVSFGIHMEAGDGKATLHREVDGGYEVVESSLPVVVSCQKGLAEWRIPNMRGIMAAKNKPLAVIPPTVGVPRVITGHLELPPAKSGCVFVQPDAAEQLIDMLHTKGII